MKRIIFKTRGFYFLVFSFLSITLLMAEENGKVPYQLRDEITLEYDNEENPLIIKDGRESSEIRFQVRDFAASSEWKDVKLVTERPFFLFSWFLGRKKFLMTEKSLGTDITGEFKRGAPGIDGSPLRIDFEVRNTQKTPERFLQCRLIFPLRLHGWEWWDSIYRRRKIISGGHYATLDYCGVGEAQTFSRYPFAAISRTEGRTFCLGLPPDQPRICRIEYDAAMGEYYAQFDFAVSEETVNFPNSAMFSVVFFECRDGFRGALRKYYQLFPQEFESEFDTDKEGIWMPFGSLKAIRNPEDFYFMIHEVNADCAGETIEDEEYGQFSYVYTEPWSFWMPVPKNENRDYDNLIRHLKENFNNESRYQATPVLKFRDYAGATEISGIFDADGRYLVHPRTEAWCSGALFYVNASPHISCPKGRNNCAGLAVRTYKGAGKNFSIGKEKRLGSWETFDKGYLIDEKGGRDKTPCLLLVSEREGDVHGASLSLDLNQNQAGELTFSAWGKSENVTGMKDGDYSLYADIAYNDGTYKWGEFVPFAIGNSDWRQVILKIDLPKPIKSISLYFLLRGKHQGKGWLDKVAMTTVDEYGDEIVRHLIPQEEPDSKDSKIDGIYLDSVEGWGLMQNYRKEHFRNVCYPLCFNPLNKKPLILNAFSSLELIKDLNEMLHGEEQELMANTVLERYWFVSPYLDIMGTETNWQNNSTGEFRPVSVEHLGFIHAMRGRKPYLYLLNTNYDLMTYEKYEKFFKVCAFYTIYPSMFSMDAASNPFWYDPKWYEPVRPLFLKYIPLIRQLRKAEWQPVTKAVIKTPGSPVLLERYGKRDDFYLALYNPGADGQQVEVVIDEDLIPQDSWLYSVLDEHLERVTGNKFAMKLEAGDAAFINIFSDASFDKKAEDMRQNLRFIVRNNNIREMIDDYEEMDQLWEVISRKGRPGVIAAYKELLFWLFPEKNIHFVSPIAAVPGELLKIPVILTAGKEILEVSSQNAKCFEKVGIQMDAESGNCVFLVKVPETASAGSSLIYYVKIPSDIPEEQYCVAKFKVDIRPLLETAMSIKQNDAIQGRGNIVIVLTNNIKRDIQTHITVSPCGIFTMETPERSFFFACWREERNTNIIYSASRKTQNELPDTGYDFL